jgi:flavin reductase (DIM6/NTAB) family NADH-FMN oxidoreductase RutF
VKVEIPLGQASRLINQGPVVLLTSHYKDRDNVMPAAWLTPLSKHPPLLGVAIHRQHFTHELIWRGEQFAINVPGRPLMEAVAKLGTVSGRDVEDKLTWAGLTAEEATAIDVPLIEECLAWIECHVVQAVEVGDHTFFVGQVVAAQAEEEAFDETWLLEGEELRPLHHLGGTTYGVIEERLQAKGREGSRR